MWNIAAGYEEFGPEYEAYNEIIDRLIDDKKWCHFRPIQRVENLVFTDCGAAFLTGYTSSGVSCEGYIYIMKRT